MKQEIFKNIPWYEWLYQVSNLWRVKSLKRQKYNWVWYQIIPEKIIKLWNNWVWYIQVWLRKNNKVKKFLVHRLVAICFIDNSSNKLVVNHKNWNKKNNCVDNLEWNTPSENEKHKYHTLWHKNSMIWKKWNKSPVSRKIWQYSTDGIFIKKWVSLTDASDSLKINLSCICSSLKWRQKTAWWFIFKYI